MKGATPTSLTRNVFGDEVVFLLTSGSLGYPLCSVVGGG